MYKDPAKGIRSTIQKRDEKGTIRHGGEWLAIWSDPDSLKTDAEKRADRAQDLLLQERQAGLVATTRSLAGRDDIDVVFDPRQPASDHRIVLQKLNPEAANLDSVRGEADEKAAVLRFHDAALHVELAPENAQSARLLSLLEHLRCACLAALDLPGMARNLVSCQAHRLDNADLLNAHLASLVPLAEALRMVCRDTFLDVARPSIDTAGFRMWDRWLRAGYQANLDAMAAALTDQRRFAAAALVFLEQLFEELPSKGVHRSRLLPSPAEDGNGGQSRELREAAEADSSTQFEPGEAVFLDADRPASIISVPVIPPRPYRAFTTAHDRIVKVAELPGLGDLRQARKMLDEKQADYRQEFTRLVARLQRRLLAQQLRQWEFDLDEGLIDASKLDRVVVNPGFGSAYKREAQSAFRDTIVTLLIDNSGSMRGKQIETACVVAEILAAALERCSLSCEILGFTTSGWKGGQSARDWARSGRPDNPGRLNDLLHIIYKDADTPLRRSRDSICAMLSPELLKENIDGEALEWAAGRLLARPEARKILFVICDGAPVDQATLERNSDKQILDRHLRHVIRRISDAGWIDLAAIGIRHDVSSHYRNAATIEDIYDLGPALLALLDSRLCPTNRSASVNGSVFAYRRGS